MKHSVLVVDDDDAIRESIIDALEDCGFDADGAVNGADALRKLRAANDRPCLILLDLMMPVLDGSGFREAQMRDPALADIPVVVCTAQTVRQSAELDKLTQLPKPMRLDQLVATVQRYC